MELSATFMLIVFELRKVLAKAVVQSRIMARFSYKCGLYCWERVLIHLVVDQRYNLS